MRSLLVHSLLSVALMGGACGGQSAGPGGLKGDEGSARTADTLTVAVPQDIGPLNLYTSHDEALSGLVYDKLVAPSTYVAEAEPWLAEDVTAVNPSTWEVTVRDGITWHDGKPFTVEDVVFTFEYYGKTPSNRWTHHVSEVPEIESVVAIDESTVRFSCAYPCPQLGSVTLADLPMIPEHVWEDVDDPSKVTELPVGTGPYRLVEYKPGQSYRFEANDDYFKGSPTVDELVMPIIQDPSTAFTALQTAEIDASTRALLPEVVDRFRELPDVGLLETSPLTLLELRLNFEREPFGDHDFRRALSLAVDRQQLLETVLLGRGRPGSLGYPHHDSPWTNSDIQQLFDRDEARGLLDELGYTDRDGDGIRQDQGGRPLEFVLKVAGTEPTFVRTAELLVEQFAEVGIKVSVRSLDPGTIGELFTTRDFDMYIGLITAHGLADPDQFIMSHLSGYLWNAPEIPYPELDALIKRWKRAESLEERKQVSFAIQELFNRQPTTLALYYPDETFAVRVEDFSGWAEARGYGIVHKWSFLPEEVREDATVKNLVG